MEKGKNTDENHIQWGSGQEQGRFHRHTGFWLDRFMLRKSEHGSTMRTYIFAMQLAIKRIRGLRALEPEYAFSYRNLVETL